MAILQDPQKLPAGISGADQIDSDYKRSGNAQVDQVFEQLGASGFSVTDPWTLRIFLRLLRKSLNAGANIGSAVSAAIGEMVSDRESYKASHTTGSDTWPPHGKMPVRFGDPRSEIEALLLGPKGNSRRHLSEQQRVYTRHNTPIEKGK